MELDETETGLSRIILAGGTSRRMGKDKVFVHLDGIPLLYHILNRGGSVFQEQILVTNQVESHRKLVERWQREEREKVKGSKTPEDVVRFVSDRAPGLGPVAGLEAGLKATNAPVGFVCSCDMPLIQQDVVESLLKQIDGLRDRRGIQELTTCEMEVDALIPVFKKKKQPLCALYRKEVGKKAGACLDSGIQEVHRFLESLSVRYVEAAEMELPTAPPHVQFLNINTPEDVSKAERVLDDVHLPE